MPTRKKILWLCSWYPSRLDPFNGDFIQRHAQAASLYNDIHVIHAAADTTGKTKKKEVVVKRQPGLVEQIVYYPRSSGFAGKLFSYYQWLSVHRDAIRQYLDEVGKPDLVHVHVPYKTGLFALWIKRKFNVPYVVTEHWGIYNDIERLNYAGRSAAFKRATRSVFINASAFTSVSRFLAEGVNRLVIKKDYVVIPNVVNTDLFFHRDNAGKPFRFIHVSNMVPLKNPSGILRVFRELLRSEPRAELIMIGNRDESIPDVARELDFPDNSLWFRGEIPYEQVAREMQEAHCLILFSNIENSPCVIGEALCCGLPVIATKTGGIPELTDQSNAILVTPGDESALTAAMQRMIHEYNRYDPAKIAADAANRFSYPVTGGQFNGLYHSLLDHD